MGGREEKMGKPILSLDFDGVCHSYTSGWKGAANIPDDAVPGLFEFLEQAAPVFDIQVFSSRSNQLGGIEAMQFWFVQQRKKWREAGGQGAEVISISFPQEKPAATIGLDDRVVTFEGTWPNVEMLRNFKPWNKRAQPAAIGDENGQARTVDMSAQQTAITAGELANNWLTWRGRILRGECVIDANLAGKYFVHGATETILGFIHLQLDDTTIMPVAKDHNVLIAWRNTQPAPGLVMVVENGQAREVDMRQPITREDVRTLLAENEALKAQLAASQIEARANGDTANQWRQLAEDHQRHAEFAQKQLDQIWKLARLDPIDLEDASRRLVNIAEVAGHEYGDSRPTETHAVTVTSEAKARLIVDEGLSEADFVESENE